VLRTILVKIQLQIVDVCIGGLFGETHSLIKSGLCTVAGRVRVRNVVMWAGVSKTHVCDLSQFTGFLDHIQPQEYVASPAGLMTAELAG